jgi:hypothetical protein
MVQSTFPHGLRALLRTSCSSFGPYARREHKNLQHLPPEIIMEKKFDRFCHLDEDEYWREICAMSELELRAEHKLIQQNMLSASAGLGASGVAGMFLFPMWALTAVHARRINVNSRQCDMIERRLAQKGWHGHDIRKRDLALCAGPCVAAELVVPCGSVLLSQAAIHGPVTVVASHVVSTTTQQTAQVASEHYAQVATQHMAHQMVSNAPFDSSASALHNVSSFSHSALQGEFGQGCTFGAIITDGR